MFAVGLIGLAQSLQIVARVVCWPLAANEVWRKIDFRLCSCCNDALKGVGCGRNSVLSRYGIRLVLGGLGAELCLGGFDLFGECTLPDGKLMATLFEPNELVLKLGDPIVVIDGVIGYEAASCL